MISPGTAHQAAVLPRFRLRQPAFAQPSCAVPVAAAQFLPHALSLQGTLQGTCLMASSTASFCAPAMRLARPRFLRTAWSWAVI